MNSKLFTETMQGLIEAIAIDRGVVDVSKVSDMPYDTYRVAADEDDNNSCVNPQKSSLMMV